VVAAICYGVASVMQAVAARAASHRPAPGTAGPAGAAPQGVDPGLLVRMLGQWRFVASLGLDTLGFLGQLIALHRLPLFAVQAMIAANLAVTAVVATWLIGAVLHWREWIAVGGVVTGVGLLGSSAGPEGASQASVTFKLALIVAIAGLALIGLAAGRLPDPLRTPVLGVVAGTGYGVLAVAARVLNSFSPLSLVRDPATYALIAAGILGALFGQSAFNAGPLSLSLPVVDTVEPTTAVLLAVLVFRESLANTPWHLAVQLLGAATAVTGIILLSRSAVVMAEDRRESGPAKTGTEPGPSAAAP